MSTTVVMESAGNHAAASFAEKKWIFRNWTRVLSRSETLASRSLDCWLMGYMGFGISTSVQAS